MSARARLAAAIALVAILAGIALRFYRLDAQVYWQDETATSVRVAGATYANVAAALADGRLHPSQDVFRYQHPLPGTTSADTVRALVADDPQHPPLYYLLERWWTKLFGTSVAARRSLSACFGVAGVAAAAWAAWELFGGSDAALVAAALCALSPFAVVYSQQAREYSLWLTLTWVASAALARALRSGATQAWLLYAFVVAAGFYTQVLFAAVVLAHALTVIVLEHRRPRVVVRYAAATAAAVVAFAPWLLVVATHRSRVSELNAWTAVPWPPAALAAKWAFNAGATFFDAAYVNVRLGVVSAAIVVLAGVAAVDLWRRWPARSALAITALGAVAFVPLAAVDLAGGGHRSTVARYVVPLFAAIVLAAAGFITAGLRRTRGRLALWPLAVFAALLVCGVGSLAVRARTTSWWDNAKDGVNVPIAARLRGAGTATAVVYGDLDRGLELSNLVGPETSFAFLAGPADRPPPSTGPRFAILPDTATVRELSRRAALSPVVAPGGANATVQGFRRGMLAARGSSADDRPSLWQIGTLQK